MGAYGASVEVESGEPIPFNSIPKVQAIVSLTSGDVVVATAGKNLLVFSLESGELLFSHEFSSSIVQATPCYEEDDRYAIALVLSDGTLDMISPYYDVTNSTNFSRLKVPFAIGGAFLANCDIGNPVALVSPAGQPNRLVSYLFFPYYDESDIEEFTLDELIGYGRSAIEDR